MNRRRVAITRTQQTPTCPNGPNRRAPGPAKQGSSSRLHAAGHWTRSFSDFIHWKGEAASPRVPRKPEIDRPAGSLSGRRAAVIGWWVIASTLSLPSSRTSSTLSTSKFLPAPSGPLSQDPGSSLFIPFFTYRHADVIMSDMNMFAQFSL